MEVWEIPFLDRRRNYRVGDVKLGKLVTILNNILGEEQMDSASSKVNMLLSGNYYQLPASFFLDNHDLRGIQIIEYNLVPKPNLQVDKIHLFEEEFLGKPHLVGEVHGYDTRAFPVMTKIIQAVSNNYRQSLHR